MHIREYTDADLASLRALHAAQRMPYAFPDLSNPLFLTRLVAQSEDGRAISAVFLRLTAEAYFLLDPTAGTPRDRWRALLLLHEAARGDANRRGLDDAHAWLPPQVARAFGRRIERLGWSREPWPCYSRSIAAPTPFL
jgi:hypothetical protein